MFGGDGKMEHLVTIMMDIGGKVAVTWHIKLEGAPCTTGKLGKDKSQLQESASLLGDLSIVPPCLKNPLPKISGLGKLTRQV